MSVVDPVDRAGWLAAVLALEDEGEAVTDRALAQRTNQRRAHTRRMMAKLRDAGVLSGVARVRLSGRGRWYMGRPVLVYIAAPLSPSEPYAWASELTASAVDIVAGVGAPAVAHMPTALTLAAAAQGNPSALAALATIAERSDAVVVLGNDPLTEFRADVVAAERADVHVIFGRGDPVNAVLGTLCSGGRRP